MQFARAANVISENFTNIDTGHKIFFPLNENCPILTVLSGNSASDIQAAVTTENERMWMEDGRKLLTGSTLWSYDRPERSDDVNALKPWAQESFLS